MAEEPAPVLIPQAAWAGSLAAIRELGAAGIPVVASYERFADAGRWSRHARHVVRGPRADDPDGFIEWLTRQGRRRPGLVLIPTGDATAWLYSRHREKLAEWYRVGAIPPLDTLLQVIDKARLTRAAQRAGLPTALTWDEEREPLEGFLCRAGRERFWMKPRTQAGLLNFSKGVAVSGEIATRFEAYQRSLRFHPAVLGANPELARPVLQAEEGTGRPLYHLTGFMHPDGRLLAARAARKPIYHNGFGLMFESAPIDDGLLEGVVRLCRQTGYFGMFEVEFLEGEDGLLVTDFNTRCFRELAFDRARGLPLARLAHALASGDEAGLERLAARAGVGGGRGDVVWIDHIDMWRTRIVRAMGRPRPVASARELRRGRPAVDPFLSKSDPLPGLVRAAAHVKGFGVLFAALAMQRARGALSRQSRRRGHR